MRGSAQPLVGRRTELQVLEGRLFQAVTDGPPIIAVTGEAGIGKSRLVAELTNRAESSGVRILAGACLHLAGGAAPLSPIGTAVGSTLRSASRAGRKRLLDGLADLAPLLPSSLRDESARSVPRSPQLRQQRIFDALLDLFDRLDHDRLLLVLEDLHWADDATTDFLRYAARHAPDRVMSIVTVRTDATTRNAGASLVLRELERAGELLRLELGPLSAGDIGALVTNLTGHPLSRSEEERLHSRADGNPYYAQELALAGLAEHQGMPPSLQDVLLARFATQPADVQELLRTLAVLGREASTDLLLAVQDLELADAEPLLRQAVQARLLEPMDGIDGYRFRHALMREAVSADLLPSERSRRHHRAAMALESSPPDTNAAVDQAAVLAHHWEASGDTDRALVARSHAAELAQAAGAINDAYRQARAALNLWERASESARGATGPPGALHLRFSVLAHGNGRHDEAQRGLAAAQALGVPRSVDEHVLLLDYRCNVHWALSEYDEGLAAAEEALRVAPASRPDLKARAHRMMAGIHYIQRRPLDALATAREGLPYAIAAGDLMSERYLHWVVAACSLDEGDVETALSEGSRSYAFDGEIEPLEAITGPANHAVLLASCGRYAEMLAFAEKAGEAIRRYGLDQSHGTMLGNMRLVALARLGRLAEADELCDQLDVSHDLVAELATERRSFAAELRVRQGRFREAADLVDRCNDDRTPWSQEWTTATVATVDGEIAAWTGAPLPAIERLRAELDALRGRTTTLRFRLMATLMRLHADVLRRRRGRDEDGAAVSELRARALTLLAELEGRVPEWDALLVQVDAEFRRISGDELIERWTDVVRLWDLAGLPYEASYARCRLGEALLTARRRASAAAVLRDALARASGIGAEAVAQMATDVMVRGRLASEDQTPIPVVSSPQRPVAAPGSSLEELSAREREVLALVAEGLTNRQIADRLFISEKTAATHVSNILGKLRASSRAQAAAMLVSVTAQAT